MEQEHRTTEPANNMATTGFVLGIVSIFFGWTFIVPILATVFSAIGLERAVATGKGKVFAWIGMSLGILYTLVFLATWATHR